MDICDENNDHFLPSLKYVFYIFLQTFDNSGENHISHRKRLPWFGCVYNTLFTRKFSKEY